MTTIEAGPGRPLKPIELEAVAHLANGLTYKEAGREMHKSHASVKRYIHEALTATGARNAAQLCVIAIRSGQLS